LNAPLAPVSVRREQLPKCIISGEHAGFSQTSAAKPWLMLDRWACWTGRKRVSGAHGCCRPQYSALRPSLGPGAGWRAVTGYAFVGLSRAEEESCQCCCQCDLQRTPANLGLVALRQVTCRMSAPCRPRPAFPQRDQTASVHPRRQAGSARLFGASQAQPPALLADGVRKAGRPRAVWIWGTAWLDGKSRLPALQIPFHRAP